MITWIKERLQKRYWVRIVFKSGAVVEAQFTIFKVQHSGVGIANITWKQNRFCQTTMLHLDVDAIDFIDGELVQ
jgi:phage terminase Nu1 subunit (DNA packaging protein)